MNNCLSEKVVLGIDIGGTNVRLAFVNQEGLISKTKAILVAELGTNEPFLTLLDTIATFIKENENGHILVAIGIGIPGIVGQDGTILSCPNIAFLEGINLKNTLTEQFKVPTFVEKDVNFLLFSELAPLNLADKKNIAGFYIGTGFGCGLLINGDIFRGSHGFAGELGHIPLVAHNRSCNCGNEGCLELYGAGRAIVEKSINLSIDIETFFLNPITVSETKKFINYIEVGILTTINIFDPELIVIGGGVVQMPGFPWEELEKGIRSGLRSNVLKNSFKILPSQAGRFAGCLGAATYYFR